MFKKILAMALALLLVNLVSQRAAYAASTDGKEARFIERVKEDIHKLGTGPDARVEVKLRDKSKFKGYISEAGDESFVRLKVS